MDGVFWVVGKGLPHVLSKVLTGANGGQRLWTWWILPASLIYSRFKDCLNLSYKYLHNSPPLRFGIGESWVNCCLLLFGQGFRFPPPRRGVSALICLCQDLDRFMGGNKHILNIISSALSHSSKDLTPTRLLQPKSGWFLTPMKYYPTNRDSTNTVSGHWEHY